MSAKTERYLPPTLALIIASIAAFVVFRCDMQPLPKALAAGTMTFGVVVSGFAATQRNMLLGMRGSNVLRFAIRTGYHNDILDYLMHCVYAGLGVSVVSLVAFFLGDSVLMWRLWIIAVTFFIVLVLTLILRNEILMVRVVKRFIQDE